MMSKLTMNASAIFLFGLGVVLNFAPHELAVRAGFIGMPLADLTLQLLAGALLGLGAVNWMSRQSLIGGIYGRAIGIGNLLHFSVGAFALGRAASAGVAPELTWALFGGYLALALAFAWLIFLGGSEPASRP